MGITGGDSGNGVGDGVVTDIAELMRDAARQLSGEDATRYDYDLAERLEATAAEVESAELTDTELRKMWRRAGGSFHGPRVETGTMPEEALLPFLRNIYRHPPSAVPEGHIPMPNDAAEAKAMALLGMEWLRSNAPGELKQDAVPEGWKEAAIAWSVCASIHRKFAKGKDALFTTRQADFVRHEEGARAMLSAAPQGGGENE